MSVDVKHQREAFTLGHELSVAPDALLRPDQLLLAVVDPDVHLVGALGVLSVESMDVDATPSAVEALVDLWGLSCFLGRGSNGKTKEKENR